MIEITQELNLNQIAILLSRYGFELRGYTPQELIEQWQPIYPLLWIRLAVVEALYQGRYKVISVEQILNFWLRRGQPNFHFNLEFERLICQNLIQRVESEPSAPTELQEEVILEANPSPPADDPGENSSTRADPREALSNLEELFSQFTTPDPRNEAPSQVDTLEPAQPWSYPKVPIDQFTPLLDSSGVYSRLKAVIQKG